MGDISAPAFLRTAGRLINARQSRVLVLGGNIHDLFPTGTGEYQPLVELLQDTWAVPGRIVLTYELNGPIRFRSTTDRNKLRDGWLRWRTGLDSADLAIQRLLQPGKAKELEATIGRGFDDQLAGAIGKPSVALELLRQFCLVSRNPAGFLEEDLVIIVEGADLLMPDAPVPGLGDADRQRLHIALDWFTDPGFIDGDDVVVLISESRSQLHHRLAQLPQVLDVAVDEPDVSERAAYIAHFRDKLPEHSDLTSWSDDAALAQATAGLSLQALRQLLLGAVHNGGRCTIDDVVEKVEQHIRAQLGEDVVEFSRPQHSLADVVGFTALKQFLDREMIPRLKRSDEAALPGAAVCGPIGAGKTFIFEAVAAELDLPVLVLKNIRSQWFGQTDVILERLQRVLTALDKVVIIVDEADTQFGGVGAGTHDTERRLTGKIQGMMSDPKLRGRVVWLLMTARIHLLSPDLRRPGRVGDLIIPVLDPEDAEDRRAFVRWLLTGAGLREIDEQLVEEMLGLTAHCSAAAFAALRSELKAKASDGALDRDGIAAVIADQLPADIADTRRFQTLQALVNCTRRSLLPDPDITEDDRALWQRELRELSARGVS